MTSGLQHFGAGVVFAAAAIKLLPGVLERSPLVAVVGFAAGIAVMFGFRAVSERLEERREAAGHGGLPIGLAVAIGVDFFIDGLILGAGFAAGHGLGSCPPSLSRWSTSLSGSSLSATLAGTVSRRFVALAPVAWLFLHGGRAPAVGVAALAGRERDPARGRARVRRRGLHAPRDRGSCSSRCTPRVRPASAASASSSVSWI